MNLMSSKIVKIAAFFFVLYIIFNAYRYNANNDGDFFIDPKKVIINKLSKDEDGKVVLQALANNALKKKYGEKNYFQIMADAKDQVYLLDTQIGSGKMAFCGNNIEISYDAYINDDLKFDSTDGKLLNVKLGANQIVRGLEDGIINMREGGVRKIYVPPSLGFDNYENKGKSIPRGAILLYKLKLHKVIDDNPDNILINIKSLNKNEDGKKILCGDKISFTMQALNLPKTQITTTIGNGQIYESIERALIGISEGSDIEITSPKELLVTKGNNILQTKYKELSVLKDLEGKNSIIFKIKDLKIIE